MKKALVLAGGFPQIALIRELKARGYTVVLADWNEAPVAREYCDIYYRVSTLDVEAIRNVAAAERVDCILTVCTDQALLTVARVSEELGLPCYLDYQTALNVTNKQYMKQVFAAHGIPTARFLVLDEFEPEKLRGFRYPLIVKPVDCNSSKGVKKALCEEELRGFFYEAKALSRTHTAIVEEFIEGPELTADVYVQDGKAILLSCSRSDKIRDNDKFVIFRTVNPAGKELAGRVTAVAQQIADAFGLRNTPMLIQLLTDGENVYVIEFSARTGGGVKYLLIREVSGFDVIGAVVDLTEGKRPEVALRPPAHTYLVNEFIYCRPGVFERLEGFDELKSAGVIADYYLFKWKGAEFNTVANSGDRIAGFTLTGDTPEEIREKHRKANAGFRVIGTDGEDLARHDLLTEPEL